MMPPHGPHEGGPPWMRHGGPPPFPPFPPILRLSSLSSASACWRSAARSGRRPSRTDAALGLLRERFARGEIDREEFEARDTVLTQSAPAPNFGPPWAR